VDWVQISIVQIIVEAFAFLILVAIGEFVVKKLKESDNQFLDPKEYLPDEELHSVKQVYYLIMMALCFIIVLYLFVFDSSDLIYATIFDVILSMYIAITIEKDSKLHKILVILLIPFGSLTYMFFDFTLIGFLDLIHLPIFIYLMKYYYDNFKRYTENNSLGITIVLLFLIIVISFFFTIFVEGVNPLDSLVMVSNAFTSNGYAVLGSTIPGKINSLFLVWSGYLISGVGTATLTAALLIKHFNRKFEKLEELIEKNNKD
jgi:hypothetical protein